LLTFVKTQNNSAHAYIAIEWRNEGGTSAPGRSTLGAPNWGRNFTY